MPHYDVETAIRELTEQLLQLQHSDGSWRFGFENGILTDAYMIITLRILGQHDSEALILQLHDRIKALQQADGSWRAYPDESEGNLAASVEAYYALWFSRCSRPSDPWMLLAKQYIVSRGGLRSIQPVLTKLVLAVTGQYPWPASLYIPLELLLLPSTSPLSFFDFSAYARIHLAPMLLLANQKFVVTVDGMPDLSELSGARFNGGEQDEAEARGLQTILEQIKKGIDKLSGLPQSLHQAARLRAEQYMLNRIEPDGTLYCYATATFLMIYALLALGYGKQHPVILRAVEGLKAMVWQGGGSVYVQNSPSTVWDTALISHALQKAGIGADHPAIQSAGSYLLNKQQTSPGDWSIHNSNPVPGGWGFSEHNTMNPDVDDTTAALRAIHSLTPGNPSCREAWNRGLNWVLSMQNSDGGWASFEKNTNVELLTLLPIEGAKAVAIDPSSADLTGRALEYLGNHAGLHRQHLFIKRAVEWLQGNQEEDGSWYGRWGVCYIYGTWAALTGMRAVGVPAEHPSVQKGVEWLLRIQNQDGGWGESCRSDRQLCYAALGRSTPSQTAWALDALIAVYTAPLPKIEQGMQRLVSLLKESSHYPTGSGLPGFFYNRYHSYDKLWPLYALTHYRTKYNLPPGTGGLH